jgi:hypothetical protein
VNNMPNSIQKSEFSSQNGERLPLPMARQGRQAGPSFAQKPWRAGMRGMDPIWRGDGRSRRHEPHVLQRNESGNTFMRVELKRHECSDPRIPALPRVALDRIFARKVTDCYAKFRESPRKFAQIKAVVTRLFGFLRVSAFFWRVRKREKEPQSHKGTEPIGAHGMHALPCAMAFSSPTFPAVRLSARKIT